MAALLREAGVHELVFVGQKLEDVMSYLGGYAVDPERSREMGRWKVSTLVAQP